MLGSTFRRKALVLLLTSVTLPLMVGCATGRAEASAEHEHSELKQRAEAYWGYIKSNDRLGAWRLEAASKDRSITLEGYLKRGGIVYDSIEVRKVLRIDGDDSEVDVRMQYSVPSIRVKGVQVEVRDRWRKIDGEWFHVLPSNPLFSTAG